MDGVKNIIKTLVISVVIAIIVAKITFSSSSLMINIFGVIFVVGIEVATFIIIKKMFLNDIPINDDSRENVIERFCNNYGLNISKDNIRTIVEASYYSKGWSDEVQAFQKDYENIGVWITANEDKVWLRLYLATFTALEISPDMDEQYSIVVEKHFANLAQVILSKEFVNNDDVISFINDKYYLTFDRNSYAIWKAYMIDLGYRLKLKNDGNIGVVGFNGILDELIKKYEECEHSKS